MNTNTARCVRRLADVTADLEVVAAARQIVDANPEAPALPGVVYEMTPGGR